MHPHSLDLAGGIVDSLDAATADDVVVIAHDDEGAVVGAHAVDVVSRASVTRVEAIGKSTFEFGEVSLHR